MNYSCMISLGCHCTQQAGNFMHAYGHMTWHKTPGL